VDALSDDGTHGLTLIAFIGSVFSPWYKWARRGGRPADPANHVCMNVALYGATRRWAMLERGAGALSRSADSLRIGASGLRWDGSMLTATIEEITSPLPSRLRGTLRVHPQGLGTRRVTLDGVGQQRWAPIAPRARIEVEMDQPSLRWQGTAYCDTNDGDRPLEESFVEWNWCRAPVEGGTVILYHGTRLGGEPFCEALRYDSHGDSTAFDPPPHWDLPRTFWRMPRATRSEIAPSVQQALEDAPFYARSVVRGRLLGQDVTAVHESLSLQRFVQPVVQFMLPFKAPRVFGREGR
jgi:carotenoid 1,2-hydratase